MLCYNARPMNDPSHPARHRRLDAFGLAISAICLVHCLALPLLAVLVPAFAIGFDVDGDHTFHWVLFGLAVPISTLALWRGAARSANYRWLQVGTIGLAVMLIGVLHVLGDDSEVPVTALGVTLLAIAHVKNFLQSSHRSHAAHSYAIQDRTGTMPPVLPPVLIEDES
jgi:hypothetical protein